MFLSFKPYGGVGISFIIIAILLATVSFYLGKKLRGQDKKFNLIMVIVGFTFIVLEAYHEIARYMELGQYDWSSFPFQFCTMTLYISFLFPFLKKGRVRDAFTMFLCLFTFLSGILPIVFAQGNLFRWPTIAQVLFSFVWHLILFFVGGLSIGYLNIGKVYKNDKRAIYGSLIIFVCLTVIAQLLNVSIHYLAGGWAVEPGVIKEANYIENYYFDPDSASLFYISPYFRSNIGIVFADVWLKAGWVVNWILYDLVFMFGAYVVYFNTHLVRKLIDYIRYKRNHITI